MDINMNLRIYLRIKWRGEDGYRDKDKEIFKDKMKDGYNDIIMTGRLMNRDGYLNLR